MPAPRFVSLKDAAAPYGVSVDTLRRRIASGQLTGYRLGPRILRVDLDEVEQLFRPTTRKTVKLDEVTSM